MWNFTKTTTIGEIRSMFLASVRNGTDTQFLDALLKWSHVNAPGATCIKTSRITLIMMLLASIKLALRDGKLEPEDGLDMIDALEDWSITDTMPVAASAANDNKTLD